MFCSSLGKESSYLGLIASWDEVLTTCQPSLVQHSVGNLSLALSW